MVVAQNYTFERPSELIGIASITFSLKNSSRSLSEKHIKCLVITLKIVKNLYFWLILARLFYPKGTANGAKKMKFVSATKKIRIFEPVTISFLCHRCGTEGYLYIVIGLFSPTAKNLGCEDLRLSPVRAFSRLHWFFTSHIKLREYE